MYEGYYIQYKFILPESVKYSSYAYQKLFRAIYGYTQVVTKANGKKYFYHREGILSKYPFIRHGKNSVIIPHEALSSLIEFFKTGKNPTHKWSSKGDWKAVYYMDEKKIEEALIVEALERFLDKYYVSNPSGKGDILLKEKLETLNVSSITFSNKKVLLSEMNPLLSNTWFKVCKNKSEKLASFWELYQKLSNL